MDQIELLKQQIEQSQHKGDIKAEYILQGELGNSYFAEKKLLLAADSYEKALEIARSMQDRIGEGATLSNLGNVYAEQGKIDQAITLYQEALKIAKETGDRRLEGNIFNNLGLAYTKLDDEEAAKNSYEEALEIARETEDRLLESNILSNLLLVSGRLRNEDQVNIKAPDSQLVDEYENRANISSQGVQKPIEAITEIKSHRQRTRFYFLVILTFSLAAILVVFFILSLQGAISPTISGIIGALLSLVGVVFALAQWLLPLPHDISSEEQKKRSTRGKTKAKEKNTTA